MGPCLKPAPHATLPRSFHLDGFDNDVYRSLAGFAREHGLIKRGKTLDEKVFFEFHWAYFFRVFADGTTGTGTGTGTGTSETAERLWAAAPHVARGFRALMSTVKRTPEDEYLGPPLQRGDGDADGDGGGSSDASRTRTLGARLTLAEMTAFSKVRGGRGTQRGRYTYVRFTSDNHAYTHIQLYTNTRTRTRTTHNILPG